MAETDRTWEPGRIVGGGGRGGRGMVGGQISRVENGISKVGVTPGGTPYIRYIGMRRCKG